MCITATSPVIQVLQQLGFADNIVPEFADGRTVSKVEGAEQGEDHAENVVVERVYGSGPLAAAAAAAAPIAG